MDVLLCSARDVSEGQDTVAALADALQHHDLDPGHFEIALLRVLALRNSLASVSAMMFDDHPAPGWPA